MSHRSEAFSRRVQKPWGEEIIFTPPTLGRTGKIMTIKAGKRLSLQYHDAKEETLCLFSGRAYLWLENAQHRLYKFPMSQGFGYTIAVGETHRVEAITDCVILEVSDPERGNTVRLEDDYSRGVETEEVRASEDRGWHQDEKKKT
ncbi:MAG: cupin [Patescibacteria group bacterium]